MRQAYYTFLAVFIGIASVHTPSGLEAISLALGAAFFAGLAAYK
jgi:hypothetical protein